MKDCTMKMIKQFPPKNSGKTLNIKLYIKIVWKRYKYSKEIIRKSIDIIENKISKILYWHATQRQV